MRPNHVPVLNGRAHESPSIITVAGVQESQALFTAINSSDGGALVWARQFKSGTWFGLTLDKQAVSFKQAKRVEDYAVSDMCSASLK